MDIEDIAKVLRASLTEDEWRQIHDADESCGCGGVGDQVEVVVDRILAALTREHVNTIAPLVEQAKREGAAEAGCGGCRGRGAHRRLCPRHPGYHPWLRLIAAADSIGDSVGVPELANRAWSLAGAIRVAMLDHPYRAERAAQTPRDGGGS